MSNPNRIPNPLDNFQSYSVHYVLLAARTTVAAQEFTDFSNETVIKNTLTAIENTKRLGDPVVYGSSTRDVFLVLDTRRFAQFSVENLKYDVYINGLQKGASTSNLAADLSMTILDSVGISFANFMQWLMDVQMETNFDGLVFLLRTIFVGHNEDGSTSTIQTETIPMHLNKMDIDLNFAKGSYTLEFMPNMNFDVNRYSRFTTVSMATNMFTGKNNNTLLGIITSLQETLNERSQKYYDDVQAAIKSTGYKSNGNYGRKVNYMITLPKEWESYQFDGAAVNAGIEAIFTKEQKAREDAAAQAAKKNQPQQQPTGTDVKSVGGVSNSHMAVVPGRTITSVLDTIFSRVPQVMNLGNFKTKDSQGNVASDDEVITFYKFITGITSDESTMTVHVDVVEFKVPNVLIKQGKNKESITKNESEFFVKRPAQNGYAAATVPKNYAEFDYIFTGKNLDILNFDMKIQDFQFLLSSNLQVGGTAIESASDNQGVVEEAKTTEVVSVRRFDPLVLPQNTEDALKNFSKFANYQKTRAQSQETIKSAQEQTRNLSMFYAMSPITVALTIRGNPIIMHKFNMGRIAQHTTVDGGSKSYVVGDTNRDAYRQNLEKEILRTNPALKGSNSSFTLQRGVDETTYATSPMFCKINIMGPAVDFRTNEEIAGQVTSSVLSDNFYVVFKVTNKIEGHNFTQELELYSHNIFGRQKMDTKALADQFGGKK